MRRRMLRPHALQVVWRSVDCELRAMRKFREKPVVDAEQLTHDAVVSHVLDKTPLPDGCHLSSADWHAANRTVMMDA